MTEKVTVDGENVAIGDSVKADEPVVAGDGNQAGNSGTNEIGVPSGKVISLEDYRAAAN